MTKKPRGVSPIFLDEKPQRSATVGYTRRRIVFGWYGGKFSHLDWLLPPAAGVSSLLRAVCWFWGRAHQPSTRPCRDL